MTKVGGLGDQLYLHGEDMSGDVGSLSRIGGGPGLLVVTAIDKYAEERVGGHIDGGIEFASWFNPYVAPNADKAFRLRTTDVIGTYFNGAAVGGDGASCVAKQLNWDGSRATDGAFSFACALNGQGFGVEWGVQHTAGKATHAGATNAAGYHSSAALTAFGGQMYIQVFSVADNTLTVKLQDCATDNPAAYVDVPGLTTVAIAPGDCPTAYRVASTNTENIDQWTRVVTTGAFSSAQFAVLFCRNLVADMAF